MCYGMEDGRCGVGEEDSRGAFFEGCECSRLESYVVSSHLDDFWCPAEDMTA